MAVKVAPLSIKVLSPNHIYTFHLIRTSFFLVCVCPLTTLAWIPKLASHFYNSQTDVYNRT